MASQDFGPGRWQLPDEYDGQPVSAQVRELLRTLSEISRRPEELGLDLEVAALGDLLRFLAADGSEADMRAVRDWCAYDGGNTDYAPDWLNDLYEGLGLVDVGTLSEECETTPAQLLRQLERHMASEGTAPHISPPLVKGAHPG